MVFEPQKYNFFILLHNKTKRSDEQTYKTYLNTLLCGVYDICHDGMQHNQIHTGKRVSH